VVVVFECALGVHVFFVCVVVVFVFVEGGVVGCSVGCDGDLQCQWVGCGGCGVGYFWLEWDWCVGVCVECWVAERCVCYYVCWVVDVFVGELVYLCFGDYEVVEFVDNVVGWFVDVLVELCEFVCGIYLVILFERGFELVVEVLAECCLILIEWVVDFEEWPVVLVEVVVYFVVLEGLTNVVKYVLYGYVMVWIVRDGDVL